MPVMKDCPNYGHWKKMIKVWCLVTEVKAEKHAELILLTLDSYGQNLAYSFQNQIENLLIVLV